MTVWSDDPEASRLLAERPNGLSVLIEDDNEYDMLTGSAGTDWFFANLEGGVLDKITDLDDESFASDLDWILAP